MKSVKAAEDEHPLCPHCEKELTEVVVKKFDDSIWQISVKSIYSCPHCRKVLGFGQWAWT